MTLLVAASLLSLAPQTPPPFRRQMLTDQYTSDGITAGDINRDGRMDVVAGPFWYEGPDFARRHEFYPAKVFPTEPSPTDSMYSFVHDFDGDGWPDILVLGRVHLHSAYWYENPRGKPGPWAKHFVFERVQGESPPFLDVDGDGTPELVAHWEDRWGLIQPDPADPRKPWHFKPVTGKGKWHHFYHGEGIGDVNGDGRPDLILNEGWWEQPAEKDAVWTARPFTFSKDKGGAQMFAVDVDGDGDNDVVTALNAHGWGLAWFEQVREGGAITFREHKFMGSREEESTYGVCFSQPHALAMADVDRDGLPDLVVGKRLWAHGPKGDVEPDGTPVLYWFRLTRDGKGGARFVPHRVDDRSGVGVQVSAADLNGDGRTDLLTVSKLGAFVFLTQESWVNPPKEMPKGAEHRTFESASMKREVGFTIYLPPGYAEGEKRYPVAYYLHGMTDCESTHLELMGVLDEAIRKGEIEPMILVYGMAGRTSWFSDAPDGSVMGETVIVKELVPHVDKSYRTVPSREGRALQGWSMGGHGALKLGLKYPEMFSSVVAYGGGFRTGEELAKRPGPWFRQMFGGDAAKFQADSPWEIARANADKVRGKLPIAMWVGSKDGLLEPNRRMKALLEELKLAPDYAEIEGVGHEPKKVFAQAGLKALQFTRRNFTSK
jgi:enterochelin esterase-like enzyme